MTQEEILQYNKLCVEFLEFKYKNQAKFWAKYPLDNNSFLSKKGYMRIDNLQFHSDWNWIMEVVEKIQTLDKLGGVVMILQGRCKITSRMAGDHSVYADVNLYFDKGIKGQKEAVVQAINQFLIWYKQNK